MSVSVRKHTDTTDRVTGGGWTQVAESAARGVREVKDRSARKYAGGRTGGDEGRDSCVPALRFQSVERIRDGDKRVDPSPLAGEGGDPKDRRMRGRSVMSDDRLQKLAKRMRTAPATKSASFGPSCGTAGWRE